MQELWLKARAKINLTLDVTGKRPDGYHTLKTVMQTIALYDGVYLKKIEKPVIRIKSNLLWLPTDRRNLIYQAVQRMQTRFSLPGGIFVSLDKRIPVAAGLAGGSTDCAAALWGINQLYDLGLSLPELSAIGVTLGADVPYCLAQGTALAEGIGEILTPVIPSCPFFYVVLVKPPVRVTTESVYRRLVLHEDMAHPDTNGMLAAIKSGDTDGIGMRLSNVLETVTAARYPIIQKIKETLLAFGATGAAMSGSGPSVYGLFIHHEDAKRAAKHLASTVRSRDIFVTSIYSGDRERGADRNGL